MWRAARQVVKQALARICVRCSLNIAQRGYRRVGGQREVRLHQIRQERSHIALVAEVSQRPLKGQALLPQGERLLPE